jgi:hypothetical protein
MPSLTDAGAVDPSIGIEPGVLDSPAQFPEMDRDATRSPVDAVARILETDADGFDEPFTGMGRRAVESSESGTPAPDEPWQVHVAGRDVEDWRIEVLANRDGLPRKTNVPPTAVPICVARASDGWARPVALSDESSEVDA